MYKYQFIYFIIFIVFHSTIAYEEEVIENVTLIKFDKYIKDKPIRNRGGLGSLFAYSIEPKLSLENVTILCDTITELRGSHTFRVPHIDSEEMMFEICKSFKTSIDDKYYTIAGFFDNYLDQFIYHREPRLIELRNYIINVIKKNKHMSLELIDKKNNIINLETNVIVLKKQKDEDIKCNKRLVNITIDLLKEHNSKVDVLQTINLLAKKISFSQDPNMIKRFLENVIDLSNYHNKKEILPDCDDY